MELNPLKLTKLNLISACGMDGPLSRVIADQKFIPGHSSNLQPSPYIPPPPFFTPILFLCEELQDGGGGSNGAWLSCNKFIDQ